MKILWIDLLCFKTIIIACLKRSRPFDCIHYINVHKTFLPFVNLTSKILKKPIIQIDYVVEPEEYINNSNLYEVIQNRIYTILGNWLDSPYTKKRIIKFVNNTGFNKSKYSEHLKDRAYFFAFKQIEIFSIAEVIGKDYINLFLLKKTPLNKEIKLFFEPQLVDFYSYSGLLILKRKKYYFDWKINKNYYRSTLTPSIKLLINWFSTSFSSLFTINNNKINLSNIGVELIQRKIKLDFISDTYWLKNSNIDLNSVVGLTSLDYDSKSLINLDKLGIQVFNISGSIFKSAISKIRSHGLNNKPKFVFVDTKYFMNTISSASKIFTSLFLNNSFSWFSLQESYYFIRTEFWKSMYSQFDIKMLWTMYDIDQDKLVKAQALELCEGLYLGSHWSNYPMSRVDNAKCYDVYFVWSMYFVSNIFSQHFNYKAVFQVGYSSDHYFKAAKKESVKLKDKYSDSFVISYFDNILANDLLFSEKLQSDIYTLLIELLKSHKNIIVFFKPKKKNEFNDYLSKFPVLIEFINIGRVRVFYGDSERSKARPAEIALASDLVIGQGISSAAAEGCFAGSVSFHANLSKINNDFDKNGLNKVVFRDLNSLKKAIINQINGKGISVEECQDYHKLLDPFQDGLAYIRTGSILSQFQTELKQGDDIDKVIKKTKDRFSELCC
jgi:hypothetical protein